MKPRWLAGARIRFIDQPVEYKTISSLMRHAGERGAGCRLSWMDQEQPPSDEGAGEYEAENGAAQRGDGKKSQRRRRVKMRPAVFMDLGYRRPDRQHGDQDTERDPTTALACREMPLRRWKGTHGMAAPKP